MGADIVHSGHINIIETAKKYGTVIVGLFSDEAISESHTMAIMIDIIF